MNPDDASAFEPLSKMQLAEAKREHVNGEAQAKGADFTDKMLAECIALEDTHGAAYFAGREIPPDSLPGIDGKGDLLFHPSLWHKETKRELPAVVCRMRDETGKIVCAQRIFLQRERSRVG